ncbi:hypothetical protein YPPY54_1359 [Yersinia pestis PY-54]|nr:hypothetical protein YPPY54_1359 [Yersinia pestis PY-54]
MTPVFKGSTGLPLLQRYFSGFGSYFVVARKRQSQTTLHSV